MKSDLYLRTVLTVIAAALVYLCVVWTPVPTASAQGRVVGGKTPGEYTGPAEVVIVDWRLPDGASLPVNVLRGDVRVTNDVTVTGSVELEQPEERPVRTVVVGYEEGSSTMPTRGIYRPLGPKRGLPVSPQ